ncbi:MAG: phosphohistidine phosphatase SixA [Gemmatimonadota bacterium]
MDVYLVHHGRARSEEDDPARPLTEGGRTDTERVSAAIGRHGIRLEEIWHSGKLRAAQTAEILGSRLKPSGGIHRKDGLAPWDPPGQMAEAVAAAPEPVMLVGHLPHLGRLASLLLVGDEERELVAFRNAGVLCLSRDDGRWRIRWYLPPELS